MKQYKAVIIGCGAIAPMHCNGIIDNGHSLVALCDTNEKKAQALAAQFAPGALIYTDYKKMIDETECDAVHICTPHYLHFEMAKYALETGHNVYLEKPVCMLPEQATELAKIAEKSKKLVTVSFQNRFIPVNKAAFKTIAEHGGVTAARAMLTWFRSDSYYTDSGWRGKYSTEGGSTMINQAIHTLDLLIQVCGQRAETVCASIKNCIHTDSIETEDTCDARITFNNGSLGIIHATTAYSYDAPVFLDMKCGDGHTVTIYDSTLMLDGKAIPYETDNLKTSLGKECWGTGHVRLIGMFYDALEKGQKTPISIESAAEALHVLCACYRSNGKPFLVHNV